MNKTNHTSALCKSALLALGVALSLVLVPATSLKATEAAVAAKSLPLKHSFAKVEGETGPHTLTLTNTSKESIKVHVKILLSVYSHASDKAKNVEETVGAGKSWTITKLAALDKVAISAEGYAPLDLVVK